MKLLKLYMAGIVSLFLLSVLAVSCTKSFDQKLSSQTDFNTSSFAQVFVATVNASRNYVYMDGKQITGTLMVSGSVFPSTGYGFAVPGGVRSFTIRDTLRTSTQLPLVFSQNLDPTKKYTIFMYDTITSPKQVTVPTILEMPEVNTSRLRFANFIYAPFALPPVDIYSYIKQANIFTNVPVTGVTEFSPYLALTTDTLYFRETGTMNQLFKLTLSGGISPQRNYTLVYRGSHRGTRTYSLFTND